MSGPLAAPPSVATVDGKRLVVTGTPNVGDVLTFVSPGLASWGPPPAPAAQAKSPLAVGGLSMCTYLSADFIQDTADGAALTHWSDAAASSAGRDYVVPAPAVGLAAPFFRARGGPRSLPCVDHSAGAGGLWTTTAPGPDNFPHGDLTFFAVMQVSSVAAQSILNGVITGAAEIQVNALHLNLNRSGVVVVAAGVTALVAGRWTVVLITVKAVGTVVTFDIGGVRETFNVGGTVVFDASATHSNFGLYQSGLTGNNFAGKIAEVGMYNTLLSDDDQASLKAYLTAKYL